MKLYISEGAPNPRRITVLLAEKNIDLELIETTIMKGMHKTPEYRRIAPNGRIPALELDDGSVILETVAIARYLDALYPEPPMFGTTPREVAEVEMWIRRIENEIMLPFAFFFRHTHPAMAELENQFPEFGKAQEAIVERSLRMIDKRLSELTWVAGNKISFADIVLSTCLDFFPRVTKIDITEYQHLVRWYDSMKDRPSYSAP